MNFIYIKQSQKALKEDVRLGKNIRTNYFYNLIYQLTAVLLPLITMPYIARTLNPEGIGINSYTNANIQYFVLLGTLGMGVYANKTIAIVRDNKEKLKRTFWELAIIQFICCSISYILFALTLVNSKDLSFYYFLQSPVIIATAIDVSWYFIGIEDFKKASLRSFFIKISAVLLMFIFVKNEYDLWKYILINSGTLLIGQAIMWRYVDKEILNYKSLEKLKFKEHLMPILTLFIPQIATQVYMVMDKTMTGLLTSTVEVGFYDQSQKIIRLTLAIVTSLGTVMLPRISNLFSKGKDEEARLLLHKSFKFISFLSIPIAFGIIIIAPSFVPIFFGKGYERVIGLTRLSSVMIIVIGLGNVFGTQYLLPRGFNKQYTISVCIGAITNLLLNLVLIPIYGALGAVIATISAELLIAVVQAIYAKSIMSTSLLKETYYYWISAIIMFFACSLVSVVVESSLLRMIIQIGAGAVVYFICLITFKDQYISQGIEMCTKNIKMKIIRD